MSRSKSSKLSRQKASIWLISYITSIWQYIFFQRSNGKMMHPVDALSSLFTIKSKPQVNCCLHINIFTKALLMTLKTHFFPAFCNFSLEFCFWAHIWLSFCSLMLHVKWSRYIFAVVKLNISDRLSSKLKEVFIQKGIICYAFALTVCK